MNAIRDIAAPLLLALMLIAAALCGEGAACVHSFGLPGRGRDLLRQIAAAASSGGPLSSCAGPLAPALAFAPAASPLADAATSSARLPLRI